MRTEGGLGPPKFLTNSVFFLSLMVVSSWLAFTVSSWSTTIAVSLLTIRSSSS